MGSIGALCTLAFILLLNFSIEGARAKPIFKNCDNYAPVTYEEQPRGTYVFTIKATDGDLPIIYSLMEISDKSKEPFFLDSRTGVVTTKRIFDFDNRNNRRRVFFTVWAEVIGSPLRYAYCQVQVTVLDINDNRPIFEKLEFQESIPSDLAVGQVVSNISATDIDNGENGTVVYHLERYQERTSDVHYFEIDRQSGKVTLRRPIDEGRGKFQMRVIASDLGTPVQTNEAPLIIMVVWPDPPTFEPHPIVISVSEGKFDQWRQPILNITANANTEDGKVSFFLINGLIHQVNNEPTFLIRTQGNAAYLMLNRILDYESVSQHAVIVRASNNKKANAETRITINVEDVNEEIPCVVPATIPKNETTTSVPAIRNANVTKEGESKILVYKYRETSPFKIGRVYLDDKDLSEKTFSLIEPSVYFTVDVQNGDISMHPRTPSKLYELLFAVFDHLHKCRVLAKVNVTVKQIPENAVDNSGSIRFKDITKEQFIAPDADGKSKRELLQTEIAGFCGVPEENVDVFTITNSPEMKWVDVRYSVHNSGTFWPAETLDAIIGRQKEMLEYNIQLKVVMIRIDECLSEGNEGAMTCPKAGCTNTLTKKETSIKIFTNTSSFVGVHVWLFPKCSCTTALILKSCNTNECLNGGTCLPGGLYHGYSCDCKPGYNGPLCQKTSAYFKGTGWAFYPPLTVCLESTLSLRFSTSSKNGLILYNGPMFKSPLNVKDFVSLELRDGRPQFIINYGEGVTILELPQSPSLNDNLFHSISVTWNSNNVSMRVDDCKVPDSSCYVTQPQRSVNSFLNVNAPLHLGGLSFDPNSMKHFMNWSADTTPTVNNFNGIIEELIFNGKLFDLGSPSLSSENIIKAVLIGAGTDFNIILIPPVVVLALLVLLIAIVCCRRHYRCEQIQGDLENDVRKKIINPSDEGDEDESDGFSDLKKATNGSLCISPPTDEIAEDELHKPPKASENVLVPYIESFLQLNKNLMDSGPDSIPHDEVSNYAHEGDGNSVGTVSGTDDGDMNFDHLSKLGPRFKRLVDIHGEQSIDDENYTEETWC